MEGASPHAQPRPGAALCTLAELVAAGGKLCRRLPSGRGIVIWLLRPPTAGDAAVGAEVAAADHLCYHHGGPLVDGDIEELALPPELSRAAGGRAAATVVLCPWHLYKIDVRSGACYYRGHDAELKSKGVRQRTHGVTIDADGGVHVTESGGGGGGGSGDGGGSCAAAVPSDLPSDAYAHLPFRSGSEISPVGMHSSIASLGRARLPP